MSRKKLALIILAVLLHQFIIFFAILTFIIVSIAAETAGNQDDFQPKETNTIRSS